MIDVRPREANGAEATCPLCREGLGADLGAACRACGTRYHPACLAELGGCSTLGCSLRGVSAQAARTLVCTVCGQVAADEHDRRRCGCRALVHQACVDAHAEACERGRRLRGDSRWRPAAAPERVDPQQGRLLQAVAGALVAQGLVSVPLNWDVPLAALVGDRSLLLSAGLFAALAALVVLAFAAGPTLDRCEGGRRQLVGALSLLGLLLPGVGLIAWAAVLVWFARGAPDDAA